MGPRPLLTAVLPELFTVLWAMYLITVVPVFGIGSALDTVANAFLMFCAVFMVAALSYNHFVGRIAHGSEKIKYPLLAGLAGAWFFMDSLLITILALCTFDVGVWGTREANTVKSNYKWISFVSDFYLDKINKASTGK